MATIKTVKPAGGGDFTTLALWEDAVDGESSADQWAECYAGGNLGAVNFSGWSSNSPSSGAYPKIYAADGEGHGGNATSGAYISASDAIQSSLDYVRIDGIRISNTSNSTKAISFLASGTSKDVKIENCFIHGTFQYGIMLGQNSGSGTTISDYITNNIIIIDGTSATTPTGIYVYGTEGSGGITNIYIYHNSIYVANTGSLNNYGIRWANASSSTLNLTVENNVVIGAAPSAGGVLITYAYDQISYNTGTKTFNNNIGSDPTADDFGGSNHQLNETADNVWQDASNSNFNLFGQSVALNNGKTIAYVTTDIAGTSRPQPELGAYDIGAIERKVKVEIIYGTPPAFEIPSSLISTHEYIVDALIEGSTGQVCQLVYPITKNSLCPNCIYSPRQKKSSNIYKDGGPIPFEKHTLCPWCGGEGRTNRAVKEDIRLRVYWTPKDWIVPKPVENPDGMAMVIGYMYNLPKIEKADTIMLNKKVGVYRKWIYEREGEAIPWGLSQDRYFAQMLRRAGGG